MASDGAQIPVKPSNNRFYWVVVGLLLAVFIFREAFPYVQEFAMRLFF